MTAARLALVAVLLVHAVAWADAPASAPASAPATRRAPRHPRPANPAPAETVGTYDGVVLDRPAAMPARPGAHRPDGNLVTWVGFHMQGKLPRVFVQLSAPAHFVQAIHGHDLVVTIPVFKLGTPNNARSLDTRWFKTDIVAVTAEQAGADVEIHVRFAADHAARQADVSSTDEIDGTILSLDFPPVTQP